MATGIVSIALRNHSYRLIDRTLAFLAVVIFVVLVGWTVLRLVVDRIPAVLGAHDPDVVLGRFTFVAACAVLGVRFVAHPVVLWSLAGAAALGWLVLAPLAVGAIWPPPITTLRAHAHGGWLLAVVGTAGLAITAADLATGHPWPGWIVLSVTAWVLALLLYPVITGLIVWRAVAEPMDAQELKPDSWILMGSLAISVVAGGHLLTASAPRWPSSGLVEVTRSAVVVLWVLASLWIPVLLGGHVWRIVHRRSAPRLDASWWAAVFPLGMYSAATEAAGRQLDSAALVAVATVFGWLAFGLWVLIAGSRVHGAVRTARGWAGPG